MFTLIYFSTKPSVCGKNNLQKLQYTNGCSKTSTFGRGLEHEYACTKRQLRRKQTYVRLKMHELL
jgi:hypothetical protein